MDETVSAISTTMWWVLYVDGHPRSFLQGTDQTKLLEQVRSGLMGTKYTSLDLKPVPDAPADDVLRVGYLAIQGIINQVHPTARWYIGYFDLQPALLIASGSDEATTLANVKGAMLGQVGDKTITLKPYDEAPTDDVIRASVMGIITSMGAALAQAARRVNH